jgi:hypothetical protein
MGVHGECGHAEGLGHDNGGGFVADSRQGLQGREISGHIPAVLFDQDAGEVRDRLGFAWGKPAGADDGADGLHGHLAHILRVIGESEKGGSNQVHTGIGALGREQDGDQQGERILVIQRDRGFRVECCEPLPDVVRALLSGHARMMADGRA